MTHICVGKQSKCLYGGQYNTIQINLILINKENISVAERFTCWADTEVPGSIPRPEEICVLPTFTSLVSWSVICGCLYTQTIHDTSDKGFPSADYEYVVLPRAVQSVGINGVWWEMLLCDQAEHMKCVKIFVSTVVNGVFSQKYIEDQQHHIRLKEQY